MTTLNVDFVVESCCYEDCNLTFAMTREFYNRVRNDHSWWFCPLGHTQHYTGTSNEQKLRDAAARETALRDQLEASIRDAEAQRVELARIRQRIANGVCPCCNRSFGNVRQHMARQHPEYAVDLPAPAAGVRFKCSCGMSFKTHHGLRIHQGKSRSDEWARPGKSKYAAHLTEVVTR